MIKTLNIIFFIFLLFLAIARRYIPAGFAFSAGKFHRLFSRPQRIIFREVEAMRKEFLTVIMAAVIAVALLYALGNNPMISSGYHVVTQAK